MTINEKAAYLKGLMEGLQLDTEKAEGKMIAAIVDLLGDVTKKLTNVEDTTIAISDELDEIEEDLDAIEDFIMDEEDDEDYDDDDDDFDDYDDEDFDEEGFDFGDEDTTIYEVKCVCGNVIAFDEETLEAGSIICEECGETLEFSFDDEDEDDYDEEGFDFGDEDTTIYEVKCICGNVIAFDEETLEEGSIICEECGETLEFSFEDEDEDEE